jgi:hypothetical protein
MGRSASKLCGGNVKSSNAQPTARAAGSGSGPYQYPSAVTSSSRPPGNASGSSGSRSSHSTANGGGSSGSSTSWKQPDSPAVSNSSGSATSVAQSPPQPVYTTHHHSGPWLVTPPSSTDTVGPTPGHHPVPEKRWGR